MGYKLELPDIGEGVVEAEVQKWFVKPGDEVVEDQALVEVMTDKATVTIPSPRRGKVLALYVKEGEVARIHAPLIELETDNEASLPPAAPRTDAFGTERTADTPPVRQSGGKPLATPAVRALAREMGLDLGAIPGTGQGGRVTKEDLHAFGAGANGHDGSQGHSAFLGQAHGLPPARVARGADGDERIPLRGVRRKIAENVARSKHTAAHFTFVEECDVTELVKLKEKVASAARDKGVKVTFLPFVMKAVVGALRKFPKLNATMDDERNELVLHGRFDFGLASATEAGLVVPVVREVDRLTVLELAGEVERLSAESKTGRMRPEDTGRSTFTLTSLGPLGGLFATPVLNYPEVGILGLHRIRQTPVVRDGAIVVREVMLVSVTSDHRVVDGHEAAAFCYEVIRQLEDPGLLFLALS